MIPLEHVPGHLRELTVYLASQEATAPLRGL